MVGGCEFLRVVGGGEEEGREKGGGWLGWLGLWGIVNWLHSLGLGGGDLVDGFRVIESFD